MIVSRSADYALRAMVYLARLDGPRYVPANEIANEMRTPPFLLSRILQHLVRGDLLVSLKGHHGGFRLRKRPDEVTLFEIIHLIDGPFVMHDCSGKGDCGLSHDCSLRTVFTRAERHLEDVFRSVTLADVAQPRANGFLAAARGPSVLERMVRGAS
jgi:Rrf2 family protein